MLLRHKCTAKNLYLSKRLRKAEILAFFTIVPVKTSAQAFGLLTDIADKTVGGGRIELPLFPDKHASRLKRRTERTHTKPVHLSALDTRNQTPEAERNANTAFRKGKGIVSKIEGRGDRQAVVKRTEPVSNLRMDALPPGQDQRIGGKILRRHKLLFGKR